MIHPLDLHGIRFNIGVYLNTNDLINCSRVSREWNSTFSNIIWRNVILDDSRLPTFEQIQAHAEHIYTLAICFLPDWNYSRLNLPRLHSIKVYPNVTTPNVVLLLDTLIRNHSSSLKRFQITGGNGLIPSGIFNAIGICSSLMSLKLSRVTLTLDAVKALLAACRNKGQVARDAQKEDYATSRSKSSGLVSLRLTDLRFQSFDTTALSALAPLPHLEHIDIQRTHGMGASGFFRLLALCPNIKSFYWRHIMTGTSFRVDKWIDLVESGAWPRLTCLDVLGEEFKDEGLCRVIESLPLPLEKFMVRSTGFGHRSFNALMSAERHYNHIQGLELAGCLDVTSGMIQQIMARMPTLEYFSACRLYVTDILGISTTDRNDTKNDQEWVCTNLRTLKLCIDMGKAFDRGSLGYDELQRQVYRRLSNLKVLETLNVGRDLPYLEHLEFLEVNASVQRLDSRPSAGLGYLLSLKRLKKFSSKPDEFLTLRDIELMMERCQPQCQD